jgi:hypothetical protein
MAEVEHVQIDGGWVVHYIGVMLAGQDIVGPAHIGCKLVNLRETAIDNGATKKAVVVQVADYKIVGFGF